MADICLCYADEDRELAAGVRAAFEAQGLVCIGPPILLPRDVYVAAAARQMQPVSWVVLVVTRQSLSSSTIFRDLEAARSVHKPVAVVLGKDLAAEDLPGDWRGLRLAGVESAGDLANEIAAALGRASVRELGRAVEPPRPAPALSDLPAPMDGPARGSSTAAGTGGRFEKARAEPLEPASRAQADVDAKAAASEHVKRMALDDVPTTVAAAPEPWQGGRDEEYARRVASEEVPITAASAPGAASRGDVPPTVGARPMSGAQHRPADALNDLLSTGTLLTMAAGHKTAGQPRSPTASASPGAEGSGVGRLETAARAPTTTKTEAAPPPSQPPAPRPKLVIRESAPDIGGEVRARRVFETGAGGAPPPRGPVSASREPMVPPPQPARSRSGPSRFFTALGVVVATVAVLGALGTGLFGGQDLVGKLLATLKLKLNAFTFFGLFGGGKKPAEPEADLVDCSVFAPPAAPPGETVLVQVFLHTAQQAERAQFMATVMDTATALKGVQTLQAEIRRGARVTVTLAAKGLDIDEPQQVIAWRGEPVFAQFLVTLPRGASALTFHPVVRIAVDGGLVGRIAFAIRADAQATAPRSVAAGENARRYNHAFLSYASADRKEVLKRAQVLKAAGVGFFQDILSLDPGARWEKEIYKHIDRADLFLLFWSKSARDSEWVIREAEYALARQSNGDVPDIVPVILEGPPVIRPPECLAGIHFNDQITYLLALS